MLPVSDAFLAAVRDSHSIVSRARVVTPGQTGVALSGVDVKVIDGTVTLDGTADVRGRLTLTLAEAWPVGNTTADLVPYGTELAVSRGVVFGNGRIERVPLGIYRITDVDQDDAPNGPLNIVASDRMSAIIEARLIAPVQYGAASMYGTVVADLVQKVLPAQVIEWDDTTELATIGRTLVAEEDRYAFLNDLVKALGKVWYFDYRGVLVIRDPPDPTVPVLDVAAGDHGVLVSASRSRSRTEVHNAVVATGEAIDDFAAAYGVAYDLDPASVTYWDGAFGKVPRFYSSPFITSNAQAVAAARSILVRELGLPYSVAFGMVPNPALEPLDAVRVVYPPARGVVANELHVLEQLTIGLGAATSMAAATRLQTLAGALIG